MLTHFLEPLIRVQYRMSLIQRLPDGPLDIIGDIHGEWFALRSLLNHLGYDASGHHPRGRTMVFVGDLCDRGPDSPTVIANVAEWVATGRAHVTIGNHEINLLANDAKDGSGWFFDSRIASDQDRYAPYARASNTDQCRAIRTFFAGLPVGLERDDLRVIHAAWQPEQIEAVRTLPLGHVARLWQQYDDKTTHEANERDLSARIAQEKIDWPHSLEDGSRTPPYLNAHAEKELVKAMNNPIKVLVTGVEHRCIVPFYAGQKWRFVERATWWDQYQEPTPVIVGHYWRRDPRDSTPAVAVGDPHMFHSTPPYAWHGPHRNVFCVDYSVGARWISRRHSQPPLGHFRLAAMRWPERELVFDNGDRAMSTSFDQS